MFASPTVAKVDELLRARRVADAAQLLAETARRGETAALVELAHWRIAGAIVPRDLAAARGLLARAGAAGDADAALLHASFLASGTGGPFDWPSALAQLRALVSRDDRAADQWQLLKAMDLQPDGSPSEALTAEPLSASPSVGCSRSFLTKAECAYLAAAGEPALQPSVVVDPASGRMVPHPIRNSDGATFGVYAENLVVNAINRRVAMLSGTAPGQGEPLQLLRYRGGGEYRAHMDALPKEPNQRILTVILYLTDDYDGGETVFPRVGLSFRGRAGDALIFRNVTADGAADPSTLHAGLPVTRGTKLIATRWIRERTFTYPPPRPLLPDFA